MYFSGRMDGATVHHVKHNKPDSVTNVAFFLSYLNLNSETYTLSHSTSHLWWVFPRFTMYVFWWVSWFNTERDHRVEFWATLALITKNITCFHLLNFVLCNIAIYIPLLWCWKTFLWFLSFIPQTYGER
jgi:hypothetical protein